MAAIDNSENRYCGQTMRLSTYAFEARGKTLTEKLFSLWRQAGSFPWIGSWIWQGMKELCSLPDYLFPVDEFNMNLKENQMKHA